MYLKIGAAWLLESRLIPRQHKIDRYKKRAIYITA
jgi:hypothetical protein